MLLRSERLLLLITAVVLVEKLLLASVLITPGRDVSELGFGFGGYVEGLLTQGQFAADDGDLCLRSSRMPGLPATVALLAQVSRDWITVALLKNALWSAGFAALAIYFARSVGDAGGRIRAVISVSMMVFSLSPALVKHAAMITYEEGFITELLILYAIAFLMTARAASSRSNPGRLGVAPALVALLGVCLFMFKESMLPVFLAGVASVLVLVVRHGASRGALVALAVAGSLTGGWAVRNHVVSGRFTPMTSYSGANFFRGANTAGLELYPDVSLDRLWAGEQIVRRDGAIVDLPPLPTEVDFADEFAFSDHFRELGVAWIRAHPGLAWAFFRKKAANFFLSTEMTPYRIGLEPAANEGWTRRAYRHGVALWLVFGRILQVVFGCVLAHAIARRLRGRAATLVAALALIACYATPSLIGFNYERHVSLYLLILVVSLAMVAFGRADQREAASAAA